MRLGVYVYLSDVSHLNQRANVQADPTPQWAPAFRASKWFTRGWTLQELLAPSSVEFFSKEWNKIGDKTSLEARICEASRIPKEALRCVPLSQFSIDERLKWSEHRKTRIPEDRAYSLIGIFGLNMTPFYGEGVDGAFTRLMDEAHTFNRCLQDLHLSDPRKDKKRIEATKGGLLDDSYHWILYNTGFLHWRSDPRSQLLWIKGDAGKGKTMLLCGIINELNKSIGSELGTAFFFCQGGDSHINSATAVLRGLIYQLVSQQPSLMSYLRSDYDRTGRALFQDANAWIVLSEIFTHMLKDTDLEVKFLIVDALDECSVDLNQLLDLIIQTSSSLKHVKWLVSSRGYVHIQQKLDLLGGEAKLSLELKQNADQVSHAVEVYIDFKLSQLDLMSEQIREQIREELRQKSSGTFLWVSLMMQELESPETWDPLAVVKEAPPGLYQLYDRMLDRINQLTKRNTEMCRLVLSIAVVAYRPLSLAEMASLSGLTGHSMALAEVAKKMIAMCGSFLTVRDGHIYLVHQSAKDYLTEKMRSAALPSEGDIHYVLYVQSVKILSGVLKRDIYNVKKIGASIDEWKVPASDPLATARYSCVNWINHLLPSISEADSGEKYAQALTDNGIIHLFIKNYYIYWLEAVSICQSVQKAAISLTELAALVRDNSVGVELVNLLNDAHRFIMYHKTAIEENPLQVYVSALLFSPARSLIKSLFKQDAPQWITVESNTSVSQQWNACIQTLEGHESCVNDVVFLHGSAQLASASSDDTIKIWDSDTGTCLKTLKEHSNAVTALVSTKDSAKLASGSYDSVIKVWDTSEGVCLKTLKGHKGAINTVAFSHDSLKLASGSMDRHVRIWDVNSGACLRILTGHNGWISTVLFSHDSSWLLVTPEMTSNGAIKLWDPDNGDDLRSIGDSDLTGHLSSIALSHDSTLLATVSSAHDSCLIQVWDTGNSTRLKVFRGHDASTNCLAFSHNSDRLASAGTDCNIKIWSMNSMQCLQTYSDHSRRVNSLAFSHDSTRLASASDDGTLKLWDLSVSEPKASTLSFKESKHSGVDQVVLSADLNRLATTSWDCEIKIWDSSSAGLPFLLTLAGHKHFIKSIAFSDDTLLLVSASNDGTIKLWDLKNGDCLHTLKGHKCLVLSAVFSPKVAAHVASIDIDDKVKLWDTSSGDCLLTINCVKQESNPLNDHGDNMGGIKHSRIIDGRSVTFSTDASRLASSSVVGRGIGMIQVWDLKSAERVKLLGYDGSPIRSLAFSPDSRRLVSVNIDTAIKIWDLDGGNCIQTIKIDIPLRNISFDTSGSYLYTDNGALYIDKPSYEQNTSDQANSLIGGPRYRGLNISVDGIWIMYGSRKILRLPVKYRPYSFTISRDTICIANRNGQLWLYRVPTPPEDTF